MENNEKQKSEKKFCKPAKPSYSKSKEKRCHRRFSRYFGNELRPGPQNNGGPIQHVPHVPQYHGFGPAANLPHFHPEQRIFYYEKAPRFPPPFREHGSYPVCHNSPFGPVSASVFNGTTFYHYYNNAISNSQEQHENVFHDHGRECPCSDPEKAKQTIEKKSKLASSSIHREQSSSGEVTNRCLSFTSISSASSRSSSPFLLSTRSSARDSGLVSTASTDDDASLVHASSCKIAEKNLVESIKQAAEEAMSDETLLKNSYLFRQMKRNAEGFVSIKLLASSKKLKKLLSPGNESLLLSALLNSDKLKVNKTNTKVRRCFPPSGPFISNKKTTSLVLINPKNIDGIEDVTKIMKVYGEISQIRILRPDRPLPLYLKVYSNLIPQLGKVRKMIFILYRLLMNILI